LHLPGLTKGLWIIAGDSGAEVVFAAVGEDGGVGYDFDGMVWAEKLG